MYDPTIGRWLSEDPIGFAAGDANLYRYVGNSPTMYTDPSGLNPNQFGARDGDEMIAIAEAIEDNHCKKNGVGPTWREAMDALMDEMAEDRDFGSNHYYVFAGRTDSKRWTDMRHFIEAARTTANKGLGITPPEVMTGGNIVEGMQFLGNSASQFGAEDYYSNWAGIRFAQYWMDKEDNGHCFQLSSALRETFTQLGVRKKSDAQSFPFLPKTEEEWDSWFHNKATFRRTTIMEGARVIK